MNLEEGRGVVGSSTSEGGQNDTTPISANPSRRFPRHPLDVRAPVSPEGQASLYKRLGGYDAIAAVTDDFIGRLLSAPKFAKFFVGASTDTKGKIRQHIVDQLCNATGGPCVYMGRTMKQSHAGLGIPRTGMGRVRPAPDRLARQVQGARGGEGRAADSDRGHARADIVEKK